MNEKTLRVLEYNKIIDILKDNTESSLGKELVSQIKPLTDIDEIENRQKETEEALELIIKRGTPPLYGIHDVRGEIKRAEIGGTLGPGSLLKISDSLRVVRSLKNYLKETREDKNGNYPVVGNLINELSVFEYIEESINNAIISEEEISDNASPALRSIRRKINMKNDSIRDKLNSIISSSNNKKYLQDSIVTIREGRYVVPVKQENRGNFPGLVHDQSSSGATLFVEPMAVVELNNELKELKIEEQHEIERILIELTNMVRERSNEIRNNQKILQRLDFIFAKGKIAVNMDGTKPILNDRGYINIKKGRHPLLDKKKVVPIDIYIGDDFRTLVITGPNTGGKTVTLKTVGLLCLMAQSGLHIPADHNSEVGVFNKIFADIGDEQSIEQNLSTFSSHMTNIVEILKNVEEKNLVLFDELGAGTDPVEGAALAMSILDYLYNIKVRTIATTHYSQLKIYALTKEGVKNASMEFDVETLSPTYKLSIGIPGKSNAFEISKRLGLMDYIISHAQTLISKENVDFEDVLKTMDQDRKRIEENKLETERLKIEIERLKEELTDEKERTQEAKEKIIYKAKEEARNILRNAKEESDLIVSNLRNISNEIERERNIKIQEAQDKLKSKLNETEKDLSIKLLDVKSSKPPKNLKVGESVEILSLNQSGIVVSLPDDNGNLQVQVGIMKINVPVSSLRRIKENDSQKRTAVMTKNILKFKTQDIKNEIDLRGETLDEALLDLDKYLDDVYISGLKEIYIIHGKGTGVLRSGISDLLKSHKHVKSYRLGKYGEGGSGVTVVELK
ncbi:endonuclease MutS2 [Acidilutibacter cellobiosedens]|jgi:DNA mismatch repair protein MutS2|uniref:Endonuclease MutS2 n=1 Tax=Acidilutibacter cellobiosedens TaxID=2507161 RepID=A0A410QBL8_9FIRM|nr:endonuclease MutS2 [Acidilutibacter cellobiosedens]QAT61350.1 endonuclease MutS2 [Acidilutibacter cellobiosedens]